MQNGVAPAVRPEADGVTIIGTPGEIPVCITARKSDLIAGQVLDKIAGSREVKFPYADKVQVKNGDHSNEDPERFSKSGHDDS
jgi:hypothetical protein